MPGLKLKHIVSFSSEDEKHPADNILKPETYYKWRCASGGEPNATLVLQLEKASQISGVDIGNNGSAFIEVLVGRSSWSQSEEFKVLLAASSFMTPADSKAGKEVSRVRMFGVENLNKQVAAEKWDQVKVVCTQPYNLSEPFGLSFMKLYTPINEAAEKEKENTVNLGRFKLKCDDDDEAPTLTTGSFFQRRMNVPVESSVTPKMSLAASARSDEPSPRTSTIFKTKLEETAKAKKISVSEDRRQEVASALFQGAERNPKKKHSFVSLTSTSLTPDMTVKTSDISKRKMENESKPPSSHVSATPPPAKKLKDNRPKNSETPKSLKDIPKRTKLKIKKKNVVYNKILSGVVFALSGYQNPERGNIRDLALAMGARYEPAWSNRCTHLICAFANTPKYREVIGEGKIVRKKWIDECNKNNRRLNTKDFRLDGGGDSSFESSGSDEDNGDASDMRKNTEEMTGQNKEEDKKDLSECDTEDEIEKIRSMEKANDSVKSSNIDKLEMDDDVYNQNTDDEESPEAISNGVEMSCTKDLSNASAKEKFFESKVFFFYGDFDPKDSRLLKRYITDHAGSVADYMKESVDFVISEESWDSNFQQALDDNSALVFVQPKWIFKCHEKQEFIPFENYEIKGPL